MNKSFVFLLLLLLLVLIVAISCKNITRKIIFTYEWPLVLFITFRTPHTTFHLPSSLAHSIHPLSLPYLHLPHRHNTCVCTEEPVNEWVRIFYCGIFRYFSARYLFYILCNFLLKYFWFSFSFFFCCLLCVCGIVWYIFIFFPFTRHIKIYKSTQ